MYHHRHSCSSQQSASAAVWHHQGNASCRHLNLATLHGYTEGHKIVMDLFWKQHPSILWDRFKADTACTQWLSIGQVLPVAKVVGQICFAISLERRFEPLTTWFSERKKVCMF